MIKTENQNEHNLIKTRYKIIDTIGYGAYGVVCSAVDILTGEKVAIKKFLDIYNQVKFAMRTLREFEILRQFKHDNIISVRNIFISLEDTNSASNICIVMDLMESDLHKVIYSKQELTDEHCRYFAYQLLRGLKYIHSANIIHRDLKPGNILINENCHLRIADFGMSRGTKNTGIENMEMTQYVATRWYRAPELLVNYNFYTTSVDMWSVGCILAEIQNRKVLFKGTSAKNTLNLIVQAIGLPNDTKDIKLVMNIEKLLNNDSLNRTNKLKECLDNPSDDLFDLVKSLLVIVSEERMSVNECLKHEYLAKYHDEEDEPLCEHPFDFKFEKQFLNSDCARLKQILENELQNFQIFKLNLSDIQKHSNLEEPPNKLINNELSSYHSFSAKYEDNNDVTKSIESICQRDSLNFSYNTNDTKGNVTNNSINELINNLKNTTAESNFCENKISPKKTQYNIVYTVDKTKDSNITYPFKKRGFSATIEQENILNNDSCDSIRFSNNLNKNDFNQFELTKQMETIKDIKDDPIVTNNDASLIDKSSLEGNFIKKKLAERIKLGNKQNFVIKTRTAATVYQERLEKKRQKHSKNKAKKIIKNGYKLSDNDEKILEKWKIMQNNKQIEHTNTCQALKLPNNTNFLKVDNIEFDKIYTRIDEANPNNFLNSNSISNYNPIYYMESIKMPSYEYSNVFANDNSAFNNNDKVISNNFKNISNMPMSGNMVPFLQLKGLDSSNKIFCLDSSALSSTLIKDWNSIKEQINPPDFDNCMNDFEQSNINIADICSVIKLTDSTTT